MRTLRNVTFIALCALVYLTPNHASASTQCSASLDYIDEETGDYVWSGTCDLCDIDAYNYAINSCEFGYVMVEYFCSSSQYRWRCAPTIYH